MNQYKDQIEHFLEEHRCDMLRDLEDLVRSESYFAEIDHVAACLNRVKDLFEQEGFNCRIEGTADNHAGVLIGIWGAGRSKAPVIFTGHVDTVHPKGSFGENIWRRENGKLYGPGVLDMKGGIIMSLYVIKALKSLGFDERPVKVIWVSNEECDHTGTNADEILARESAGAVCAFNMEACLQGDKLCVYRKSLYNVFATVTGIGGHSGNFFAQGRNAVLEGAEKTCRMARLTDLEKGSTVNVSVFRGGDAQAKIPEKCEMIYDVRYSTPEEGKRLYDSVSEIMESSYIPGTTTEYEIEIPKFKALKDDEGVNGLLTFVNKVLAENNLPLFGSMKMGSCSDAGNVQSAGVPILDCCGIVGEFFHSLREYADEKSLYSRALIWALVLLELDHFQM